MRPTVRRTIVALPALPALAVLGALWLFFYAGRYLQHEDPLQKADAIFVLAGTRTMRLLEAVDLYKEGHAPVVALSPGFVEPTESLLRERGVRFPREVEQERDLLGQIGVPPAAVIATSGSADNTAQEAAILRGLVTAHAWRRVIVVTSKFHTRRAGFAFRRELAGTGAEVVIRASRYDPADPAHWWRYRRDYRFAITEWLKLIAYRLGLGG
jgi:uncharacterized SAM-binding protein YcdF (DUF218 family)